MNNLMILSKWFLFLSHSKIYFTLWVIFFSYKYLYRNYFNKLSVHTQLILLDWDFMKIGLIWNAPSTTRDVLYLWYRMIVISHMHVRCHATLRERYSFMMLCTVEQAWLTSLKIERNHTGLPTNWPYYNTVVLQVTVKCASNKS